MTFLGDLILLEMCFGCNGSSQCFAIGPRNVFDSMRFPLLAGESLERIVMLVTKYVTRRIKLSDRVKGSS